MKIFCKSSDGGSDSGVTAYFLIEWKKVFSIAILHFRKGSREAFHSHAFHALTWWLKGRVTEIKHPLNTTKDFSGPTIRPKFTPRQNFHKIVAHNDVWAFTIRGPWNDTWKEFKPNVGEVTLTHGRKLL